MFYQTAEAHHSEFEEITFLIIPLIQLSLQLAWQAVHALEGFLILQSLKTASFMTAWPTLQLPMQQATRNDGGTLRRRTHALEASGAGIHGFLHCFQRILGK